MSRHFQALVWLTSGLMIGAASTQASSTPRSSAAVVNIPKAIAWTGKARIFTGQRVVDIGASTRVEPFGSVRSDTWLLSEGVSSTRSMIIDPAAGWMERSGKREPMPAAMLAHERQQYGIYTLLLLAPALRRPGVTRLVVEGVGAAPKTELRFAKSGRLIEARNRVVDSEGKPERIEQLFRFSGDVVSDGVHWPRRIEIFERGKPYFTLNIETFTAETSAH